MFGKQTESNNLGGQKEKEEGRIPGMMGKIMSHVSGCDKNFRMRFIHLCTESYLGGGGSSQRLRNCGWRALSFSAAFYGA